MLQEKKEHYCDELVNIQQHKLTKEKKLKEIELFEKEIVKKDDLVRRLATVMKYAVWMSHFAEFTV